MSTSNSLFKAPSSPMPTIMVVPTGIGCDIGGFAGDAMPAARLLAAASGCLITHPNVMNGASLYWVDPRISYVEGYSLDRFAAGEMNLRPVRQQKVGLLLDAGIEPALRQRHLQVVDGCRATLGLNITCEVTSDLPLGVELCKGSSGVSWGGLRQPDSLLRAGKFLKEAGATAIAVVSRFPDDIEAETLKEYRRGNGVDALAGAEALISHLLVRELGIPCAHAPALRPLPLEYSLDPRATGEELGYTFLGSVLVGLSRAPDLLAVNEKEEPLEKKNSFICADDLGALVVPDGALGGDVALSCLERGIPIISVKNPSVLNVTKDSLLANEDLQVREEVGILSACSYSEAAGFLLLLREGISLESCQRPITRFA